jgi:two-component system, sensor histidine kinase and response regulator
MSTSTKADPTSLEILVAEDSPTQAQRLRHILQQQGYQVTIAVDGRAALEAARHRKPTVIISDVVMPEMDGYELCQNIKSDPSLVDVPVILVTTMSDPQDVIRGLECRADNFIIKPYDEQYLLNRLNFVLVNREMRQTDRIGMGVEIVFGGKRHFITADRLQILNLLLSTYDAAIQRNKELREIQEELRGSNRSLVEINSQLEQEIRERKQAQAEVADLNANLKQHALELEEANKELESFSSSVSHDLRAPLRHVQGYAEMLRWDTEGQLSDKAQEHLQTITKTALKMGQLIDDLLEFSRMSRMEMRRTSVPLSALVSDCIQSLEMVTRDRNITWKIAPLPTVNGDSALLRQVFANLISNAVKYTRPRDPAEIEIGVMEEQSAEITVFIRDNGVGFNMKYANKLFGVFQRLHRAEEFEGTGIGLANVRRIIARHGGRVWAESTPDKGATFYLTLPKAA